jgi:phenylacetate-CoA ligase
VRAVTGGNTGIAGDRYLQPEIETMARADIEAIQESKLLDLLPYAYERSALIRSTWDEAGVHPRDIKSLGDYKEKAPFISKDAIRVFRDERGDPYGGLLCFDESELTAITSTSGTTGDPTLVPEVWGGERREDATPALVREFYEIGTRPGDYFTCILFTFRGAFYAMVQSLGAIPVFLDHTPAELPRFVELSLELRPTCLYNFSNVLISELARVCKDMSVDPRDVMSSYHGIVHGGEPLGTRSRELLNEWEVEAFEHTAVGDAGAATECREHDGCHFWEDSVIVEHLDPDGTDPVPDGERGELVVTALDNRVMPLVRFRSDDLVELTRERCGCGRTHGRLKTAGRKGDEVIVDGRSVLPADVWAAVERFDETAMGLFQIIRPSANVDRLRLRVGHDGTASDAGELADRLAGSVQEATGVVPEIELVANDELLRLGPPHKIPRVAKK